LEIRIRWEGDEEVESVGMYIKIKSSQETLLVYVKTAFFLSNTGWNCNESLLVWFCFN